MTNLTPKKRRPFIKINAMSQAQLIKLLITGGLSCRELAERTGLHYVTVLQYTRELYRAKAIHIHEWGQDAHGRDMIKIYKITTSDNAFDAKRYKIRNSDKSRQYREGKKLITAQKALTLSNGNV